MTGADPLGLVLALLSGRRTPHAAIATALAAAQLAGAPTTELHAAVQAQLGARAAARIETQAAALAAAARSRAARTVRRAVARITAP